MSDTETLTRIAYKAALCDSEALSIWTENREVFKKLLGLEGYLAVIMCIRKILSEGWVLQ